MPLSTVIMLAAAAVAILLLRRTRVGHSLYAVGGNAEVARLSGIRTSVPVVVAHVLCSVLAGFAGLLLLARLSVGSPTIGAQGGYDLMSIAAVVLGGTVLAGGKGNILGTLAGVGDLRGHGQRDGRAVGQLLPPGRDPRPGDRRWPSPSTPVATSTSGRPGSSGPAPSRPPCRRRDEYPTNARSLRSTRTE